LRDCVCLSENTDNIHGLVTAKAGGIDLSAQVISILYQTRMLHALLDRHYIAVRTSGKLLLGMGRGKIERS
jgi:hypothetical protein